MLFLWREPFFMYIKGTFFFPFLMHLARQKVQMTFFSRKMTFRKEKKCSFCGQKEQFFCPFLMHLHASQKEQRSFLERWHSERNISQKDFFWSFSWCIWQGKKYKWRSFLERWHSERNKKILFLWREPFFM